MRAADLRANTSEDDSSPPSLIIPDTYITEIISYPNNCQIVITTANGFRIVFGKEDWNKITTELNLVPKK